MSNLGRATEMVSRTARASAAAAEGTNAKVNNTATGVGGRPPESRRSARRAALYRRICLTLDNSNKNDKAQQSDFNSRPPQLRQYHKVGYEDAKTWMERRLAGMKSGVPNRIATMMADEWSASLTEDMGDLDPRIAEIEAANMAKHYHRWHVKRLGTMTSPRPDGVFRILGGQLNSASSAEVRSRKVKDVVGLINEWEVQAGCLSEVGVNWSSYPSSANLASWFRDEIQDIKTHTAHNKHENVAHHQPGGTATFACRELARYTKERTTDSRGLGRWCSTLFYADPTHKFRLVSAYHVGRHKPRGSTTIFQQHLRYIQNTGLSHSPSRLFVIDFIAQLQTWQRQGDRLLIFIDMNEHILRGHLAKYMSKMGLTEATHSRWGTDNEPHTYFRGTEPIDGVWHSPSLDVVATLQLSFHEGVGDHRTALVDITTS